jgi:hypothetical protein
VSDFESAELHSRAAEPPGLPPVEPPSAGFIVQLFIVPAIIVLVIVTIWLSFSWLAHIGEDPKSYIDRLKNRDWHAAYNLSQSLSQSQHNKELVENQRFAQQVADVLSAELAAGSYEPDAVMFRQYLCSSLGYFHVDAGLPVLIEVAETHRDDREVPVRCAAIEALVQRMRNAQEAKPPKQLDAPRLFDVLAAAAEDDARYVEPADEQNKIAERVWSVRERAVFALGMLGTEEATTLLETYLDSSEPNVRYNAAVGLARNAKVTQPLVAVLAEMLAPDAGLAAETTAEAKVLKRQIVLAGALPAIEQVIASDTDVDLGPLEPPLEELAAQTDNKAAQLQAKALLIELGKRNP